MINNKKYWDNRFKSGDWELNKGNEQTLFHYNILLEHMPEWLKNEISDNNFNICDLGCGMGEGVDLFKKYFKKSEIIGVDFSDYAIEKAKKVYPDNSFIRSDITNFNNHYDVIISSHTLEHFENPFELLSHMISLADKYFILIIPFQEKDLHKEHFYSFDYNFFPINVQNHKLVHYKEIDRLFFDAGGYWGKEQLILIYANTQNVDTGKFTLEQLNNNYFGEFKLQKQIYKNKITEYEKKLDSVIQEHEEKLNTQRKEYENEFVEYKKIFDVQTEHIDKLDSKIQNYEEKLNTQREEYENNLLDIQTHADELNKLNKKYLSQFLSEQKKCKKLINTNKNLEFDLFNAKKMALMFSKLSEKYSSQFLSEQKKYESLKKQNNRLNNLLKAYKSRKVVRTADSILKTYKSTKYRFKLNFNRKTDSVSILSKIKPKKIKDIKVAVILDEFSYNCFKHEFNAIPIEPSNWLEVFETKKPDLFFCESAWTGTNPEIKPWQGKIYSSINFNQENRKILLSILEYCKKHNIPTIFWNKEDPNRYDDKVYNFVDTALKFDHIFTTAEECVQKYKKDYGHKSVHFSQEQVGILPQFINSGLFKTKPKNKNIISKFINSESSKTKPKNKNISKLNSESSKTKPKKIKDIKVAVILDEFSYNCFKHEFNAIPIEPSNWLEVFETKKPDLFFCESAWTGTNPEIKPWQGKIYSSINFNQENRKILLSILEYCKKHNIPTIFWNKEDPTHYDDKVCNFVDTALKFDHIFTTAEECVQKYKKDYGHKSVHCLMFGAQPKLFNPITKQNRSNEVIFAGSWYGDIHIQRSKEMIKIFDNILNSGYSLKIYDRTYTPNNPNSNFPKKYLKYVNPAVPFDQIENVYKESRYALNINTETKSKTMFARRVFELMLCNTLVLSNYSKGMDELFGNDIIFVGGEKINLSFCEEKRSNNLYNVLRNHTYSQRFKQILDTIDYKYLPTDDNVTVYYVVNDQSEIKDILKHYESITYVNKRLTLLLSKNIPNHLIKNISKKYTNPEISVYSLINLKNKNEIISNKTPYFIFANTQLKKDFIEKGILHYSYIETNFGIALGEKFTFKKAKDINNIIFHNKKFMDVFNSIFKETSIEFTVYTLQEYKHEIYRKLKSKTSEISKIDINIPDIDIHGSCVSRDVFNFDKNKEIKIGQYFARQSFVSAVSSPFIGKINVNLPSVFQKRMIESDLRKDMFEKLSLNKANYLMIDLIDERLHLIKYNNSLFTFSDELRISKFMEDFDVEVVNKLSMDNYIWKNAMDEYIDCLLKIYAEDKIIIHESYLVESYITLDGGKKYFPEEKRRYIKLLNKFFKKYYVYLKQKLPNAHVISILGDNYCSWEGHLWDKAPMHYESRYYQDVLKIIKNIIFEEKDKPISINKSTLKKLKT